MVSARPAVCPARPDARAASADFNLRILWPLARFVEDRFGPEALRELASAGGLEPAAFDRQNHWVSAESFEAVLAHARSLVGSDAEFERAGTHRMKEAYGPLRYILWAMSPGAVFAQAAHQYRLVSACGALDVIERGPTSIHLRFTSRVPFSRLACLLRHAQSSQLPTFWGLPPAHIRETTCAGRGDACCELYYDWYATRRWLPAALSMAASALLGWALAHAGVERLPWPLVLAGAGGALAFLYEARRTERMNEDTRREMMGALRDLAQDGSEARRELLGLHWRQKDWTRLVEEEMTARSQALQEAVSGVNESQSQRARTLLGFSHDLRNPLQVIQASAEFLDEVPGLARDKDALDCLGDIRQAVDRMRRMLGDLVRVTKAQREFVPMELQSVPTAALTEGLRRRLRALVFGHDVRANVVATREAPQAIVIDPLALDRILDNLLSNAAKYTERGIIDVQLDGTANTLIIKVSDTGCGIPAGSLERIFEPGGSSLRSRRGDSFGVGLSVVVQLLDQLGGRLEIMSRPGVGTTFWVHLPLVARTERRSSNPGDDASGDVDAAGADTSPSEVRPRASGDATRRVVTIRKVPA